MQRAFVRTCLILAFLPIVAWSFASGLCRGIRSAFRNAWVEVRIEAGSFPRLWKQAGDL